MRMNDSIRACVKLSLNRGWTGCGEMGPFAETLASVCHRSEFRAAGSFDPVKITSRRDQADSHARFAITSGRDQTQRRPTPSSSAARRA